MLQKPVAKTVSTSLWLNSLHHALTIDIGLVSWYMEEENSILLARHINFSLNSKRCDPVVLSFTSFMHPCYLSHNPSVTRGHAVVIGVVKVSSPSMKIWKGHSCSGISQPSCWVHAFGTQFAAQLSESCSAVRVLWLCRHNT